MQIKNRNQINRKTRRKNYEWNIIWTWSGTGRSGTADTESPSSDPRESCVKGIVTNIYDLDDVQRAMDESVHNKADIVKGVIKIHP